MGLSRHQVLSWCLHLRRTSVVQGAAGALGRCLFTRLEGHARCLGDSPFPDHVAKGRLHIVEAFPETLARVCGLARRQACTCKDCVCMFCLYMSLCVAYVPTKQT